MADISTTFRDQDLSKDTRKSSGSKSENMEAAVAPVASQCDGGGGDGDVYKEIKTNEGVKAAEVRCIGRNNKGVTWGFSLDKGKQQEMEDNVAVVPGFMKLPCDMVGGCTAPECRYAAVESPVHYFGVFDGHGGDQMNTKVSHYCSKKLHEFVAEEWGKEVDECRWNKRWEVAFTRAYNKADDVFKDKTLAPNYVGSTALVVVLSACQIIAANCGDSRAVLCRGGQAIPLTVDHKLSREDEVSRITNAGASIYFLDCPRVEGILSMTRAIGDQSLKPGVISDPEVTFMTRSEEDECLILASDGIWDVMSNEKVIGLAHKMLRHLRKQLATGNEGPAEYVAKLVLGTALHITTDNISVIVVDLKWPKRGR
ncbi:Phosphatase 2C family protein [Quillaja saponaria]|uniref:protein-serine/threonine phosphatase n=1 Tax=Quillaja saponaria TaxID=32244 RepID=A0AAD7PPF9_QUISA|nr:Phosphatase 2C family protein [Quillaja saponaria]